MCHKILQHCDRYFLETQAGKRHYLIGLKHVGFTHDKKGIPHLYQPFEANDYQIVPEPDLDRVLITCYAPMREQMVELLLRVPSSRKSFPIFLPGGIHLSSLCGAHEESIDFPVYTKSKNDKLMLMAAFRPDDIIMFDGMDISVQQFYVLSPENHQLMWPGEFWLDMQRASWNFIQDFLKEASHEPR